MSAIQINIADKSFLGDSRVHNQTIANLQLSLAEHEFICLVGPSGCGKSTLLNIIAGLDSDFEGEVTLSQRHQKPSIGYVFQNPRLLPWRTVRENILLALPEGYPSEPIDVMLETMQLTDVKNDYPERLSLGMSRRVSIIRAFAVNPDILLMDEPFVSLDPPTARQVRQWLISLWQQRPHTVLFVTHDLREAIALADRLIFLSKSPMTAVSEIIVPIPRSERDDEKAIEAFRQSLLENHPEIRSLL
ncbi:ABC transporter ATP-binding protein [Methylicorpusculum sp.]|uniref:ABC transporter ATP-binding protein n=2 Tax=Methylicorpusculum sp. TaxID=2713644 RepID=UPI00272F8381|nr:ABC transporter ATP-binding protein [Methylicorpusculum sp.]MDP2179406.1 ABC transporter ATP-binding protein [Methylicorpusculum sp.]MDP3529613.1 ABC transporter ATP-binding protein [Methylicorpusculum sp.]